MLPEGCFYLDADGAPGLTRSELYGHAVFDDAVVFGSDGFAAYSAGSTRAPLPREGRFSAVLKDGDRLLIRTDVTGQDTLFLYRQAEFWAVSNSFLLLASQLAQRSRLALHGPAVMGFHLKRGTHIGEQLLSHRTMIEGIELVPATSDIFVGPGQNALRVLDRPFLDCFSLQGASYEETMIAMLERATGAVQAIAAAPGGLRLMLSGGYDSRLVLGLLLAGGAAATGLRITSYPHKDADFSIACTICEDLGLSLNIPPAPGTSFLSAGEALRVWALSCAGTYLPIYPVAHLAPRPAAEIRLTGDQPTGWTFFHGPAVFNGGPAKVAADIEVALRGRSMAGEARDDFLSVFDRIGIERDHPRAMAAHYGAIRSRFHCGRHWYKELGQNRLFTPLMSSGMVALEIHAGERGWSETKVFADLFSALGDWTLRFPFDNPAKAFEPGLLNSSPFCGGLQIRPRPMRVFGLDTAPPSGRAPDLAIPELHLSYRPVEVGALLASLLHRADRSRLVPFFTGADLAAARAETEAGRPDLSHGLRRATHVVATDLVAAIAEGSGPASADVRRTAIHERRPRADPRAAG